MLLSADRLMPILGFLGLVASQASGDAVSVQWLGETPPSVHGTTFGLPWARGKYYPNATTFTGLTSGDQEVDLQSWITGYWPDGSMKWTGHAIGGSENVDSEYRVVPSTASQRRHSVMSQRATSGNLVVEESEDEIVVDTGKIIASFHKSGSVIVSTIQTAAGSVIGQNGVLVLQTQSGVEGEDADPVESSLFESEIEEITVSEQTSVRTLVTVRGTHQQISGSGHDNWLPFILRFYLYSDSEAIRVVHSFVFDGDVQSDFITGIGLRFDVPLADELYDRHIRIAGVDGGILHEAVKGITGLRRDPGEAIRAAQYEGTALPDPSTWDQRVTTRLHWIPNWGDYSLSQLSSDGFTLKKRTKAGQSWINIPGGTRAGGLAYLGGATQGGLAVGLRDFWKRYPTGIDIRNAASDVGSVTMWLYSPAAEPMDLRPFHDGMGMDTYEEQLDALEITYEDYELGYNTPYGIARTNEIYLFGYDQTPSADVLADATDYMNSPPVLMASPSYINETKAIGSYWLPSAETSANPEAQVLEDHLDFLFSYYQDQVEYRRWYGFWDYGDFMHSYDEDRHEWRYDVGGYAWDNSELSPDLFFWNYFLRTGREDVYRFSEAMTRHTGEVDVYHAGNYSGLGTRHGVQHFGDSAKQIRISTPIYRRIFYYVSGGDERVGELMHEVMANVDDTLLVVDARRKVREDDIVYDPDPAAIYIDAGLDWSGLASTWLTEWERRAPQWEEARDKLLASMRGIAGLKNGFVTGPALYDSFTGDINPPPNDPDNEGVVSMSHLTAVFGLVEVVAQVTDHFGPASLPEGFEDAWLDYCYYYGASGEEQEARYGEAFTGLSLLQGHSRLTAYLASRRPENATAMAARAWDEFYNTDGFTAEQEWVKVMINGSDVLSAVEEADWISTNTVALYGVAAIENLALIGQFL